MKIRCYYHQHFQKSCALVVKHLRRSIPLLLIVSVVISSGAFAANYKRIEGGKFVPQYGVGSSSEEISVKPFFLDRTPVTNKDFFYFIKKIRSGVLRTSKG